MFFETEDEFEMAKKKAAADGIRLDFQMMVLPMNVEKVLSKRVTYLGVDTAPEVFTGVKWEDINGLKGIARDNPIFKIGEEAQNNIASAVEYYENQHTLGDVYVRDPAGNKLYRNYHNGRVVSWSISTDPPPGTDIVYDRSEPITISGKGGVFHASQKFTIDFVKTVGDEQIRDEEKSFTLGRAYLLPVGTWRNLEPDQILQPFSNAEKVLFSRLGVRIDQGYDMDLETGKTNFEGLAFHQESDYDSEEGRFDPEIISAEDLGAAGGVVGTGPTHDDVNSVLNKIRSLFRLTKKLDPENEISDLLYKVDRRKIPLEGESELVLKSPDEDILEQFSPYSGPVTIKVLAGEGFTNDDIAEEIVRNF